MLGYVRLKLLAQVSQALKIWNQSQLEVQIRATTQTALEEQISTAQLNDFFEPIQTLVLDNCYASPDSGVYRSLAHLRLDGSYKDLTPLNIVEIIAASPRLRSLAIHDNRFLKPDEPVWFDSLEFLALSRSRVRGGLKNLLSRLNSRSNAICVVMRLDQDSDFVSESQEFFRRSSVTRLHLYSAYIYRLTKVALLCPTANLQELILENCNIQIDQQDISLTSMVDNNQYIHTPWPRLHTLYLISCTVEFEPLQQLLALHPIRRLRFYNCSPIMTDWPLTDCARFEEQLSATGIDARCVFREPFDCPTRIYCQEEHVPWIGWLDDYSSAM
ncbi:hypothetical protein FRC09_011707 [Ceratobasidium sp. 395]|nr:hypothetical protein FRC09_011707 [Ceratobasidium sp. 395]